RLLRAVPPTQLLLFFQHATHRGLRANVDPWSARRGTIWFGGRSQSSALSTTSSIRRRSASESLFAGEVLEPARSRKLPPPGDRKMKDVLFVAANPTQTPFDFRHELDLIQRARDLRPNALRVEARWSVGSGDLKQLLSQLRPSVLHLLSPGVDPKTRALI